MTNLVLASTSRYRRALLERLGVPFQAVAPPYQEVALESLPASKWALTHAEGKASSLAASHPEALLIGSDQVALHDGEVLGKPGDAQRAAAQLRRLQGQEHRLLTAVVVHEPASGRMERDVVETRIRMRALTDDEIARYLQFDEPYDCAGSYKMESLGISLFESQRGDDPTAVIGLPLMKLCRQLRAFGVRLP
ncbi:MAG: nucleoside triphosphate pyrophosphatase [Planctomycetota bacterium]